MCDPKRSFLMSDSKFTPDLEPEAILPTPRNTFIVMISESSRKYTVKLNLSLTVTYIFQLEGKETARVYSVHSRNFPVGFWYLPCSAYGKANREATRSNSVTETRGLLLTTDLKLPRDGLGTHTPLLSPLPHPSACPHP